MEEMIHTFIQQINLEMFIQFLLLIKVLFVGDNVLNEIRYEEMIKLLAEIENSESPLLRSWHLSGDLKGLWEDNYYLGNPHGQGPGGLQ